MAVPVAAGQRLRQTLLSERPYLATAKWRSRAKSPEMALTAFSRDARGPDVEAAARFEARARLAPTVTSRDPLKRGPEVASAGERVI